MSEISDDASLKQEIIELRNQINKYKDEIEYLQREINIMMPFVELTKTIRNESPKTWEYFATKTINNKHT